MANSGYACFIAVCLFIISKRFTLKRTSRSYDIVLKRGTRFNWMGATAPNTVGGMQPHPPKAERIWARKINKKERRKAIRSALAASINIENYFEDLFQKVIDKVITKDAVFEILVEYAHDKKINFDKYKQMDKNLLEKEIISIINNNKSAPINAVIGKVMAKLRGKAPGQLIVQIIKKHHK